MTKRPLAAKGRVTSHEVKITPHTCRRGVACETRLVVHCSCGFGQGAEDQEHAEAIARGHRDDPFVEVISRWRLAP